MRRFALAALLALVVAAPAHAQVYDDNPATVSRGPGDGWIFARAANGEILERHRVAGVWTEWTSIGGNATSGPAAAAFGDSLFVFTRGTDGALYQVTYANGAWGAWRSIGGDPSSAPAAALRRGVGIVDLAVRGPGNAVYTRTYNASNGWSAWESRGGVATSAPALGSYADNRLNLFVRSNDNQIYGQDWNGVWSDWVLTPSVATSAPAAVSRAAGYENLYVRGPDSAIYIRSWSDGVPWSNFGLLDARPVDSGPAAAGDGPQHEWVVARGGSGLLLKEWTSGGGWMPWVDLGPVAVPVPPPISSTPTPVGDVNIDANTGCTPSGGRLRVRISIRQVKGKLVRVTFFTKGRGRSTRTDRRAPFDVRLKINRPAGSKGRVYARLYYRPSPKSKLRTKTVSGRYTVCR